MVGEKEVMFRLLSSFYFVLMLLRRENEELGIEECTFVVLVFERMSRHHFLLQEKLRMVIFQRGSTVYDQPGLEEIRGELSNNHSRESS